MYFLIYKKDNKYEIVDPITLDEVNKLFSSYYDDRDIPIIHLDDSLWYIVDEY